MIFAASVVDGALYRGAERDSLGRCPVSGRNHGVPEKLGAQQHGEDQEHRLHAVRRQGLGCPGAHHSAHGASQQQRNAQLEVDHALAGEGTHRGAHDQQVDARHDRSALREAEPEEMHEREDEEGAEARAEEPGIHAQREHGGHAAGRHARPSRPRRDALGRQVGAVGDPEDARHEHDDEELEQALVHAGGEQGTGHGACHAQWPEQPGHGHFGALVLAVHQRSRGEGADQRELDGGDRGGGRMAQQQQQGHAERDAPAHRDGDDADNATHAREGGAPEHHHATDLLAEDGGAMSRCSRSPIRAAVVRRNRPR